MGIPEGEREEEKTIFKQVIVNNFPKLIKVIKPHI